MTLGVTVTTIERRPNIAGLVMTAVVLMAGGLVWVVARSQGDNEVVPSTAAAVSSTSTRAAASSASSSASTVPASVLDRALPSASGVVLFAHIADPSAVLRIDVDRGTVVTTRVGPVTSTAPAFLAVGPSAAVVRPYDNVSGYVVADSGSVSDPAGLLSGGTSMVCSDGRRDRVWLAHESLVQVGYDGSLKAQVGGAQQLLPVGCDGAGEMLYRSGSDTLVTAEGPPTLITTNKVIAAGPQTFLVRDCAATAACALTVIDRTSGQRRSLTVDSAAVTPPSFPVLAEGRIGSISPDGHTAAVFRAQREVVFVDLVTGFGQGISAIGGEFQSFVWSPNSRYLFWITGNNKLFAFDRDTRDFIPLGTNNILALAGRLT
ncbi:MAG: hypothetical protein ABI658_23415 [Acidimicrobiales bacterium]